MPAKPRPLGLSDSQFTQLINCAEPLHPRDRDRFLRAVANRFDGCSDIGDGEFGRGLRELLQGFTPVPGGPALPAQSRRRVGAPIA
jgi:hypothetical protein